MLMKNCYSKQMRFETKHLEYWKCIYEKIPTHWDIRDYFNYKKSTDDIRMKDGDEKKIHGEEQNSWIV